MRRFNQCMLVLGCILAVGGAYAGGNADAGKSKAEACADCHGDNGKGDADNPSIAGMDEAAFTKAIKDYQSGVRAKSKKMAKSASKLSDDDAADLAAYFKTLPK